MLRCSKRGITPIIIGIAAVVFAVLAGAIWAAAPFFADHLLAIFGGEEGVYFFLVEIPTADADYPGVLTVPILNVFGLLRNIALIFFTVVLVIAGLYYSLESFRIVSEGTAASIVTGSIFTAFMIYLFLPVYNVSVSLINTLTAPQQELILSPGNIKTVIHWAIKPMEGGALDQTLSFFFSVFFLVMVAVTLISVAILGILRLFFIGAIAAMMPIILVLRLIPLTKRVADSFIEMLIGLVMSSLLASIFLRFGYEVLNAGSFQGLAGTVVAWGTLLAAAMMPTVMAPRLGSLFMTTTGAVTAAASTAAISTVGTLSGIAVGAARGASTIRNLGQMAAEGAVGSLGGRQKFGTLMGSIGGAAGPFVTGAFAGRFTGAAPSLGKLPSLGGVQAAVSQSRAGLTTFLDTRIDSFIQDRAGTATEAVMTALPLSTLGAQFASEADGKEWQGKIRSMSDEEIGDLFLDHYPNLKKLLEKNRGAVGKQFRGMVLGASPLVASKIRHAMLLHKGNEDARRAFIKAAIDNLSENRVRLKEEGIPVPDIPDELDVNPYTLAEYVRNVGNTLKVVNGKLLYTAKQFYDPNMSLGEARSAANYFAEKIFYDEKGKQRSDAEIAEKLADLVGVENLSSEEKVMYGAVAKRMINRFKNQEPRILAALSTAISTPEGQKALESERFTEAALRSVDNRELDGWLADVSLSHMKERGALKTFETAEATRKREIEVRNQIRESMRQLFAPQVSLEHLFPEELQPVNLGAFFSMVDRELLRKEGQVGKEEAAQAKTEKTGYTPKKKRKRGVVVARGFGNSWKNALDDHFFGKKTNVEGERREGSSKEGDEEKEVNG